MSAVTAQGIAKFESAPLIIPQGKQRCIFLDCAKFTGNVEGNVAPESSDIGFDTREIQRKRLSLSTKVPYKKIVMQLNFVKELQFFNATNTHFMICPQGIYLLLEDLNPEVSADKFDCFQVITKL